MRDMEVIYYIARSFVTSFNSFKQFPEDTEECFSTNFHIFRLGNFHAFFTQKRV